ncbi:unnamed protein product, partial [marine sediment metagenome]
MLIPIYDGTTGGIKMPNTPGKFPPLPGGVE